MSKVREIDWNSFKNEMEDINKKEKKTYEKKVDENLYVPKLNAEGSANVVLRFLPPPADDLQVPVAVVHNHYFNINGKYVITKCPQSISKTTRCPICEYANNKWWKEGDKSSEVKGMFKQFSAYVNILIKNDVNTPENNGKIFVMRLGKKIYDKIFNKLNPSEEDIASGETPVNIFHYTEGANFKLKIRTKTLPEIDKKTGKPKTTLNYDESSFAEISPLGSEKEVLDVDSRLIALKPYIHDGMETYERIQQRLERALGASTGDSMPNVENNPYAASDAHSGNSRGRSLPSGGSGEDDEFLRNLMSQN